MQYLPGLPTQMLQMQVQQVRIQYTVIINTCNRDLLTIMSFHLSADLYAATAADLQGRSKIRV